MVRNKRPVCSAYKGVLNCMIADAIQVLKSSLQSKVPLQIVNFHKNLMPDIL